jgi:hypothetical protein
VLQRIVDELVPAELVTRTQYAVFPYEWLYGRLGNLVQDELRDFCDQTDLFDGGEVANFIADMQTSKQVHSARQSWALLNVALWWKAHMS